MNYHYYDYFKSPHTGDYYVRWHEGMTTGLYRSESMTEAEAQKLVEMLNNFYNTKAN